MKDIGQYSENKRDKLEEKYTDLFYNAPVGYVILDSGYKIAEINKRGRSLLTEKESDLQGKPFSDFIDLQNSDTYQFFMKNLKAGKPNAQCELMLRNKSDLLRIFGASGMEKDVDNQSYRLVFFSSSKDSDVGFKEDFSRDDARDRQDLKSAEPEINRTTSFSDTILENLTILVADDDEVTRFYLSELVEKKCLAMFFAKNGKEAVELFQNNQNINLILMDIKMPVMDGYSATIKIKEINKNVIVIAQTAYALASDREKALAAGCDDYLAKPLFKKDLISVLKKFFK